MPVTARTGQRSTASITRVMPGAISASPIAHSSTDGPAVLAAMGPVITAIVTMNNAIPPPKHSTARISRTADSQRRWIAASTRASVGRVRAARRAATNAATSEISSDDPTATTIGTQPTRNTIACGTTPFPASRPNSHRPNGTPSRPPAVVANTDMTTDSPTTIRRSWPGVVPIARSRASSRCRCWIDRPSVVATTNSATLIASPPNTAARTIRFSLDLAASKCSAMPRSSPVSSTAGAPRTAWPTPRSIAARSVPGSVSTPIASTVPGCPASRSTSLSAKNTSGAPVRPATVNVLVRAFATIATRSPTRCPAVASSTTSPEPGAWPARSEYGVSEADAQPCPLVVGAPATVAGNDTSPIAVATPGTDSIFDTRAESSRTRSGSEPPSASSSGSSGFCLGSV